MEVTFMDGETKTTICLPITHFKLEEKNIELRFLPQVTKEEGRILILRQTSGFHIPLFLCFHEG